MTETPSNMDPRHASEAEALARRFDDIHRGIRKLAHDISNPLGIIRMAIYVLETTNPDEEKRNEYYRLLNQSISRIDDHLTQLRALTETPGGPDRGGA